MVVLTKKDWLVLRFMLDGVKKSEMLARGPVAVFGAKRLLARG